MHSLIFGLLIKVGRFCMLINVGMGIFRMPIKAGIFGMLIKAGIICRIEKEVARARFNFSSLDEQNEKRDLAVAHRRRRTTPSHSFLCAQVRVRGIFHHKSSVPFSHVKLHKTEITQITETIPLRLLTKKN